MGPLELQVRLDHDIADRRGSAAPLALGGHGLCLPRLVGLSVVDVLGRLPGEDSAWTVPAA